MSYYGFDVISTEDRILEIADFESFNLPFAYGTFPKNFGEIAISEAQAYIAIRKNNANMESVDHFSYPKDLVGKELPMRISGAEVFVKVSGIITSSHYLDDNARFRDSFIYVCKGFTAYHLDQNKNNLPALVRFKQNDIYDLTEGVTIYRKSVLKDDESDTDIYTETGIHKISELELPEGSMYINLSSYNHLFNTAYRESQLEGLAVGQLVKVAVQQPMDNDPVTFATLRIAGVIIGDETQAENIKKLIINETLFDELAEKRKAVAAYVVNTASNKSTRELIDRYFVFDEKHAGEGNLMKTSHDYYFRELHDSLWRDGLSTLVIGVLFCIISLIQFSGMMVERIKEKKDDFAAILAMGLKGGYIIRILIYEGLIYISLLCAVSITLTRLCIRVNMIDTVRITYAKLSLSWPYLILSVVLAMAMIAIPMYRIYENELKSSNI